MSETKLRLAFDINLMRPGCVLLQASMGGSCAAADMFDSEDWLLAPTSDLQVYELTPRQLKILINRVNARRQS